MNYNPTLHKLSNGITVILDPMDLETVNVKVMFCTGARDELPAEYGLTHFCEHMLCKGTARFPAQRDAEEYLDYNGGFKNAATSNIGLTFFGRILAENINLLIGVLGDQIQNSLFEPDKIEIERRVVADELRRALDNPARQFQDFISKNLFNYAVSSTRTLGSFENIAGFSRPQMLEFLGRRLSGHNCIIGISGRILTPDDVLKCLEKTFSFLPQIDVPENTEINYTPTIAHNPQSGKNNVKLRILFPDIWVPTYENRFQNMCITKFYRYLIKELTQVVRRENGLVYGFGEDGYGNEKFGVSGFATETSAENIERVVALIASHTHRIYTENPITDADLLRYEQKNRLGRADWLESAGHRCDRLIGIYRAYGCLYDFNENIQMSASVTRDDVIKNSRGSFAGDMSIVTQGAGFNADLKSIWVENFK